MKRATIVVAMILLLGSASLAAAECAWVLWVSIHGLLPDGDQVREWTDWEQIVSLETQSECQQSKGREWNTLRQLVEDRSFRSEVKISEIQQEAVLLKFPGRGFEHYTFHCLPDTMDPREKK